MLPFASLRRFALLLIPFVASTAGATPPPRPSACISIVGTSDIHGVLAPSLYESTQGASACADGVLALSGYVSALRRAKPGQVLLVDAGDLFQGTLAVNATRGRAMIDTFNALGYDASAIGNHEFDYGPDAQSPSNPTGSLESAIAQAQFPFLGANIKDRLTGETPLWKNLARSALREVNGVRVGLVGVSTPSTPSGTLHTNVRDLVFAQAAQAIRIEADALRAQGAELVVLLAHMGGLCTSTSDANDLSVCSPASNDSSGELFQTLSMLPANTIDVAIGAHTHNQMAHWYRGTAVVQSGAFGRYFGRVDACVKANEHTPSAPRHFDAASTQIFAPKRLCLTQWPDGTCDKGGDAQTTQPVHYAGAEVRMDPAVAKAAQPHLQMVKDRENASVGAVLPQRLSAERVAQLTAEGLRRFFRADIGLQNRGGIRLPLAAGPIRYGDVFRAAPFDNQAVCIVMTGAQIETLIRQMSHQRPEHLWPRLSGLTLKAEASGMTIHTDKGGRLEPTRRYRLATNEFILGGGDNAEGAFAGIATHDIELNPMTMRDSLASLLVHLYPMR